MRKLPIRQFMIVSCVCVGACAFTWLFIMPYMTQKNEVSDVEFALRRIVSVLREPLLGPKPLPAPECVDTADGQALSWRATLVNDFEPGIPIAHESCASLEDMRNSGLVGMRQHDFCVGQGDTNRSTSVFCVLNGQSLLEKGNEWSVEGNIPSDVVALVFVKGKSIEHWAAAGDLCCESSRYQCAIRRDEFRVTEKEYVLCIFWDLETWLITSDTALDSVLEFADLQHADLHDRKDIFGPGISRLRTGSAKKW